MDTEHGVMMNNVIKFPVEKSRWSQDDIESQEGRNILDKLHSIHTMFVSTGLDQIKLDLPSNGAMLQYELWDKRKLADAFNLWKAKWGDDPPEVWPPRRTE